MIVCGVKVSHDGAVAVLDGQRLVFSAEMEKLGNGRRYSALGDLDRITAVLADHGLDVADVDRFVVDGWWSEDDGPPRIDTLSAGRPVSVATAPYVADPFAPAPPPRFTFDGVAGSPLAGGYSSYPHATHHLYASYCTGPFAGRTALGLVWDGGTLPRLYVLRPGRQVTGDYQGPLFGLVGDAFTYFCLALEPFRKPLDGLSEVQVVEHHLGTAGKAMAYAGLGAADDDVLAALDKLVADLGLDSLGPVAGTRLAERCAALFPTHSSADLIASFQEFVGRTLVSALTDAVARLELSEPLPICLAGGCALNIKWNSMIRSSGLFDGVWVPPFTNDSGAALGTALCEVLHDGGDPVLEWDVYSGPDVTPSRPAAGWSARDCDEAGLAALLHTTGEPVVVVDGRAELGPRALGNRSILAPAVSPAMKDELNRIKHREPYRPVAPICLESAASEVFSPGGADPYMLFDHRLRDGWADRVPAVLHLDGTARLQTVRPGTPHTRVGRVLEEYHRLSGIPLLCNTSANLAGHGFFPDVATATEWAGTAYVWSGGTLYTDERRTNRA
ncbi:carbamoyltransferase N-terminal domain-containing protein [Streptomyces sp. KAU_LT]|uniref:carbamoyltransferase N-terminal domain-containing protein n=1 Tax=Streptomyces sp. KAU_LT TaxID=3046669 RepID=UPI0024B63F7E|nr:carbamoyltransferase N-terminal domain-containing protein [Streptomyces sp. KAU_LT]MDI9830632.1 carbamoyltransferase N-terminal domain-containing protein [Streptomyces sp. KAU_LT]